MPFTKQSLPLSSTHLFNNLFTDYINNVEQAKPFFNHHFFNSDFESYLNTTSFEACNRAVLVDALINQSQLVNNTSPLSLDNCKALIKPNVYTVTTGHQLCLFTGPLYFIYKIVSTINLCKTLNQQFTDKDFVPVYWMASEDHDFEEINHANVFNKKVIWNTSQTGAVGDFKTVTLAETITELKTILGDSEQSQKLIEVFKVAYLKHPNLADATRYLVNELFGEYGIVILDGNDVTLKALFKEEFNVDIFENKSYQLVNETIAQLKQNYNTQVTPRLINVFYKKDALRERIELNDNGTYRVLNTDIVFTREELKNIINTTPELLSPNVVLRPMYQQKIMPNIAYVGGPGELAYWLQFKTMFESYHINFPLLIPRQFVMLIDKGTKQKMQKLGLSVSDVFNDGEVLVKRFIKSNNEDINLTEIKKQLEKIYSSLAETVGFIDKTLIATTDAEKQKAINGVVTIELKINKAFKQKAETEVNQIWGIKQKLFPNNLPQERYDNVSMYYSKYGADFITELMQHLTYDLKTFEYTMLLEE